MIFDGFRFSRVFGLICLFDAARHEVALIVALQCPDRAKHFHGPQAGSPTLCDVMGLRSLVCWILEHDQMFVTAHGIGLLFVLNWSQWPNAKASFLNIGSYVKKTDGIWQILVTGWQERGSFDIRRGV